MVVIGGHFIRHTSANHQEHMLHRPYTKDAQVSTGHIQRTNVRKFLLADSFHGREIKKCRILRLDLWLLLFSFCLRTTHPKNESVFYLARWKGGLWNTESQREKHADNKKDSKFHRIINYLEMSWWECTQKQHFSSLLAQFVTHQHGE